MTVFNWQARTRGGELRKGIMDAESQDAVLSRLRGQQLDPVKVKKKGRELNLFLGSGVQITDLTIFTRQFATMIDAGLPLVQCIEILGTSTENPAFGKVLVDIKERVEGGSTFSDALKAHPKVFDDLYTNLVAAGEVGGILDTIMNRLALYIEKADKLRTKIKGAMVYPVFILITTTAVVTVLLWKVIPVFEAMFKDMGSGSLPAPTQFVIGVSNGFIGNLHLIVPTVIALAIGFTAGKQTKKGQFFWHSFLLKIPLVGTVIRKQIVARFSRTLGTLLSSGVPLLDSLDVTGASAGNVVVSDAITQVKAKVSEGRDLATPLGETRIFPPMVVQMIGVGEQTGALDTMLQKIGEFYEEEVDVAIDAMMKTLEPLIIVFLAVVVGGVLIAMYMPIFELAGNVKSH